MALKSSERESLKVAEEAREAQWLSPSFMRELFLGRFRLDLIHPFPIGGPDRPEFRRFFDDLARFLREDVDSAEIDRTGEIPRKVIDRLRSMGAFGMKIPKEYGGLGFSQVEYGRVMELLGSTDGNLTALLSAHQSIGVPQPIKLFGTEEQKRRFLPRCAAGAISAFALTEAEVGSDPARLATTAEPTPDGKAFVLNGEKLWCTNGTLAELLVVMARDPRTERISAFVVETSTPGVDVVRRCRFMGLKALANAVVSFDKVKVPRENLIGEEGRGLKIALVTLNTGRLTIPAAVTGTAKQCLEIVRKWGNARSQWGQEIGKHEAIGGKIATMAWTTYAMESMSDLCSALADRGNADIRLEAAAAKEWNTTRGWEIVDETLQIRGGRGYETEQSLAGRGEAPIGVERMLRDSRINRIFEGSSEIMHLFMAREAVDRHLQVAGALIDPDKGFGDKLGAIPGMAAFYATWYPGRWLGWGRWPRYGQFGTLAGHLRFAERASRRLARTTFHGMVRFQGGMQRKQAFLFRVVDVATELFAMAASISRAQTLRDAGDANASRAIELADAFCRASRRRVEALLHALWHNDDAATYRLARRVLAGEHTWLEEGGLGLPYTTEQLVPRSGVARGQPPAQSSVA